MDKFFELEGFMVYKYLYGGAVDVSIEEKLKAEGLRRNPILVDSEKVHGTYHPYIINFFGGKFIIFSAYPIYGHNAIMDILQGFEP